MNYKLKLNGTVSDEKYTQKFTEKNVTFIEFEFGEKKIEIGKKSAEAQIKELKKEVTNWKNEFIALQKWEKFAVNEIRKLKATMDEMTENE